MSHRELFYKYKGNRCGHCGMTVQEMLDRWGTIQRMFELNHVDPSKKHPKYKNMIERKILSSEQLDEVDKCVLLCVECHKALTAQNIVVTVRVTANLKGKSFVQTLKGQLITDKHLRTVSFFTDEPFLFLPYTIRFGSKTPSVVSGETLQRNLSAYILKTKTEGHFKVFGMDKREVFSARKCSDNPSDVGVAGDASFPFVASEQTFLSKGTNAKETKLKIFMRNNSIFFQLKQQVFHKRGGIRFKGTLEYQQFEQAGVHGQS